MPEHAIVKAFGMNRDRFEFLWGHFHIQDFTEDGENDPDDYNLDDDEGIEEIALERVQREQDDQLNNQTCDDEDSETIESATIVPDKEERGEKRLFGSKNSCFSLNM